MITHTQKKTFISQRKKNADMQHVYSTKEIERDARIFFGHCIDCIKHQTTATTTSLKQTHDIHWELNEIAASQENQE